ncbi:hypothetical protein [Actinoplanes sp. NBRC 101535]|uniref:hypothetical protein n=1 Tax=Actinoplanes sp. NBRC 101535 TaxID=3032196 RepID=UPI0024A04C19|nr:hypothetical protein [Actinoplanes sp. NBRC 101535]GLY07694.1 hypothetical protein Acsp01_80730 [Actinoplanes sp. NBRC 101535]
MQNDHWLLWPIKAIATLVVLPFRLLGLLFQGLEHIWDRWLRPPLAWLTYYLIVVPVSRLWRYLVAIPAAWLWRWVLGPVVHVVARALTAMAEVIITYLLEPLWRWFLGPITRAIVWFLKLGWDGTTWLWETLVVPVGRAIAWLWNATVVPVARWLHREILHPVAEAVRAVLTALGLRA